MCVFSHIQLFATPWTVTHQVPLSRQKYWRGLPFPSPGDHLDPGIESAFVAFPVLAYRFFTMHQLGSPKHTSKFYYLIEDKCFTVKENYSWWRKWQPTPVSLPEKSHGQRSLVRCSPWGCKEWGTTEHLTRTPDETINFSLFYSSL